MNSLASARTDDAPSADNPSRKNVLQISTTAMRADTCVDCSADHVIKDWDTSEIRLRGLRTPPSTLLKIYGQRERTM